jgi:hypothetical protein
MTTQNNGPRNDNSYLPFLVRNEPVHRLDAHPLSLLHKLEQFHYTPFAQRRGMAAVVRDVHV